MTHSLSHDPPTTGIFSPTSTGYSWQTNDYSSIGLYTVVVTATESECGSSLADTYTVDIICGCTLNSTLAADTSFTYHVNGSL